MMCPLYKAERLRVTPGFCAQRHERAKADRDSDSECGGCTCGEWASLHGYFPAEAEAANPEPPRKVIPARQMCKVEGCEKHPIAGCEGMCKGHFNEAQGGKRHVAKAKTKATKVPTVLPLPAPVAARPGFFLDFTGHEDVLERLKEVSEDINLDVVCILASVLEGRMAFLGGR